MRGYAGAVMRPTRRGLAHLALSLPAALAGLGLSSCPEAGSTPSQAPTPPPPIDVKFDSARAWRDLEKQIAFGPRPAGSASLEATRKWLEAELKAAGLEPVREPFKATTPSGEVEFSNVYADLAAKGGAEAPLVLLISHFDTKRFDFPFVGANDAGSSTAVLLELARGLAAAGSRDVAYRFLFVDGEEAVRAQWQDPDNRYGSKHHAAQLKLRNERARVKAAIVIDMVGDKDLKIEHDDYSTAWMYELFASSARSAGLEKHLSQRREPIADDHLSFLEIGIPSLDLIDFDYGPQNAYWHTHQDTLDKCSEASLGVAAKLVLACLPALERRLAAPK